MREMGGLRLESSTIDRVEYMSAGHEIRRKTAGKYRSQPRDPLTGRRLSIVAPTISSLEARLHRIQEIKLDLALGGDPQEAARRLRPAAGTILTLGDVWAKYLATREGAARAKAEQYWRRAIAPFLPPSLRVWELTKDRLAAWMVELKTKRKYSLSSRGVAYSYLSGAVNLLVPHEIQVLPWGKWRPEPPDKGAWNETAARSVAELEAILLALNEHDQRLGLAGIWSYTATVGLLAAVAGMRQAELAGLGWDCLEIDAEPYMLTIRYQAPKDWQKYADDPRARPVVPPKGRKTRLQLLHPSAAEALRRHRAQLLERGWYRYDGPVFPNDEGAWRSSGYVLRGAVVRDAAKAAGLPDWQKWRPHSFRHTKGTLEAQKTDLRSVQQLLGVSDLRLVERYTHAQGRGLAVSSLPAIHVPLVPVETPLALPPPRVVSKSAAPIEVLDPKCALPWAELAKLWLKTPPQKQLPRPVAVTKRAEKAYSNAYQRARYAHATKEEARERGRNAHRAVIGAWGGALSRARRALESAAQSEPSG